MTGRGGRRAIGTVLLAVGLGLAACSDSRNWTPTDGEAGRDGSSLRQTLRLDPAPVPDDLGKRAYRHCEQVVAFGPRHVGSRGWRLALLYVKQQLRALGLEPVSDRWFDELEGLTFENVHVTIPGAVSDRIVIACHHDTKCTQEHPDPAHNYTFVGANDSGSGVGLLLALAEELVDRENHATIQLVFFDGEESIPYDWNLERALFGSRRFKEAYVEEKLTGRASSIRALVLLDMVGAEDLQIDEVENSSQTLRDVIYAAARACGHQAKFFENAHTVTDDHVPFHQEGIPTANLIDLYDNPQWHTPRDTMEHISAASLQLVGEVVLTALPEIERRFVKDKAPVRLR